MDPAKLVKTMIASLALIAVGPNNGTARPPRTPPQTFLFRATSAGGARTETPEDYYCRSSGEEPRAAISAMLKYIATPAKN